MPQLKTVSDFLSHRSSESSGGGAKFLKSWKKRPPNARGAAVLNAWLHTGQLPMPFWSHNLPVVKHVEDKETKVITTRIWSAKYVCHEDEGILRKQYHRDDDGQRKHPPEHCGVCKLIEYIRQLVNQGKMALWTPVFSYDGADDPRENIVLRAGPLTNMIKWADLSEDEKKALKENRVFANHSWKENALAKLFYLFTIVDADDPSAGVQVTTEPGTLADRVKTVIADARQSLATEENPDAGDPFTQPYCIQWQFFEKEPDFNKKYHALMMERFKMTDVIRELITSEPPAIDHMAEPFNMATMRATLEDHYVGQVPLPWDEFFGEREDLEAQEEEAPENTPAKAPSRPVAAVSTPAPARTRVKDVEASKHAPEVKTIPCDECGAEMLETDTQCKRCDTVYRHVPDPPKPVPQQTRISKTGKKPAPAKKPETQVEDPDPIPF